MPKKPQVKRGLKHKKQPAHKYRVLYGILITLASILCFGIGLNQYMEHVALEEALSKAEEKSNTSKAASLDLRVASQATYADSRITEVLDLGVQRELSHKLISYSSDGFRQYAYVVLPNSAPPSEGFPVMLLLHGFVRPSHYKTRGDAYLGDMEFYARNGYAVIRPDFRGNGNSEGLAEGAYFSMAYNTDILSLIAGLKAVPSFDSGNIAVWGHSMGGYLALRAAVLSPDIKDIILLAAPVGSIFDLYTRYYPPSDRINPVSKKVRDQVIKKYGTPLTNENFWHSASPIFFLDRMQARVQIYVGGQDRIVPPSFSDDLANALESSGKAYLYRYYDNGDHGLGAERESIHRDSINYLKHR